MATRGINLRKRLHSQIQISKGYPITPVRLAQGKSCKKHYSNQKGYGLRNIWKMYNKKRITHNSHMRIAVNKNGRRAKGHVSTKTVLRITGKEACKKHGKRSIAYYRKWAARASRGLNPMRNINTTMGEVIIKSRKERGSGKGKLPITTKQWRK